jgi:hypothetical protein
MTAFGAMRTSTKYPIFFKSMVLRLTIAVWAALCVRRARKPVGGKTGVRRETGKE